MYFDYVTEMTNLHAKLFNTNSNKPVSNGFSVYDWCLSVEDTYRKSNNLSKTSLISPQEVYKFAVNFFDNHLCS